ncbi:MAG: nucleotidyl transferase AbiEii/AbiGii toxin family protein [Chlamydiae bacterium]|nr:nucleotidyl transferase AbiEii/AbiGii toxin family protein [Chlamydiota bacterium]MBI3266993.1 nucleotidyl transferase AbiEii/AbiGii toxin family protein [Chlamydiota bacterium]
MFEETLVQGSRNCLALLGQSGLLKETYLAGGTALALQLGHRISVDFDFFTPKPFNPTQLSNQLSHLGHFEDAEPEEMPKMLKEVPWKQIKSFFISEVKKLR